MARLTPEAAALLESRRIAALGTLDAGGAIHQTAVWYVFDGRRILVPTVSTYRKVTHVRERPTASVLIDTRSLSEMRGVTISGRAGLIEGDEALAINRRIHARYLTEAARSDPVLGPLFADGDDTTITIECDAVRYWNMGEGELAPLFERDDYMEPLEE